MRVLCTLAFASESINGVAFARTDEGMLSEDVAPEVAEAFARIPGYRVVEAPPPVVPPVTEPPVVTEAVAPVAATEPKRRGGRATHTP